MAVAAYAAWVLERTKKTLKEAGATCMHACIRRRLIKAAGIHTAKLEMTNGGRTNLSTKRF